MSALPAQVLTPPPSRFADVILEQKVCCFMKAAARRTAVVILSRSLHVYVSLTASVENLDMDNISRHGRGIWFLSGYMWEVLVAMG